MGEHMLIADGQSGRSSNTFFPDLFAFCVDSVATCFSQHRDKLCVLVGLTSAYVLLSLLSCLVQVYRRCTCGGNPGETTIFFYCFLGNLCNTVGAILSRQLYIQVLMGAFAAAMDAANIMTCCIPLIMCWNLKTERKLRMMRRRRRQHLLAVCVLMVVAGGFLKSGFTHHSTDRLLTGRRLLHVTLEDNTEILGYILGFISFIIACTSRFPAVCRAYRGQMLTQACMFSGLLCSLAGALYATAILLYNTQFGFLLRVLPWLLSAMCCILLDLLTLVLHWCKRRIRQHAMRFSSDTQSLLDGSGIPTKECAVTKKHRNQKVNSLALTKTKNGQKVTEMGRYMDVSVHPARKICLKEVTLSKEEADDQPCDRKVRLIRVDSFCFSDTSRDSSLVSSDLEWDFEEAIGTWRESTTKQQERNDFPLRECPVNPKPFNICTCARCGLPQKTLSDKEEGESVSAVSLAK